MDRRASAGFLKSASVLLAGTVLMVGLTCAPARSEGPAVSDTNAKVSTIGGSIDRGDDAPLDDDDGGLGGLAGSLTLPLAYAYGLQLDAAYARVGDGDFGNLGAHIFWRDPDVGLIGIYSGYARRSEENIQDLGRIGLETQYFSGQITLDSAVGYRFGDGDEDIYGRAKVLYYVSDDFMLSGGFAYEDRGFGTVGAEYQFRSDETMGMSVFAEGLVNEEDDYLVHGGLRVTFGQNMTLKDRQRRQDPENYVTQDLLATEKAQAEERDSQGKKCPFKPSKQICNGHFGEGKFIEEPSRESQCNNAEFSEENPGPKSCGCKKVFNTCFGGE